MEVLYCAVLQFCRCNIAAMHDVPCNIAPTQIKCNNAPAGVNKCAILHLCAGTHGIEGNVFKWVGGALRLGFVPQFCNLYIFESQRIRVNLLVARHPCNIAWVQYCNRKGKKKKALSRLALMRMRDASHKDDKQKASTCRSEKKNTVTQ